MFSHTERRRDDVAGMRRILHPVYIVVIHYTDEQSIDERGLHQRHSLRCANNRRLLVAAQRAQHAGVDLGILLLEPTESASHAVENKTPSGYTGVFVNVVVAQGHGEFGEFMRQGAHPVVPLLVRCSDPGSAILAQRFGNCPDVTPAANFSHARARHMPQLCTVLASYPEVAVFSTWEPNVFRTYTTNTTEFFGENHRAHYVERIGHVVGCRRGDHDEHERISHRQSPGKVSLRSE